MAQAATMTMYVVANAPVSPTDYSARLKSIIDALNSTQSGTGRPSTAVEGTLWADSDAGYVPKMVKGSPLADYELAMKVDVPSGNAEAGFPGLPIAPACTSTPAMAQPTSG